MARNPDLPRPTKKIITKSDLLHLLRNVDVNKASIDRILRLETAFRGRIDSHVSSLPAHTSKFSEFNTSPFVLMFYCKQKQYNYVHQIEQDILPAKIFSSMGDICWKNGAEYCFADVWMGKRRNNYYALSRFRY
jgi:hypothetical protein